MLELTLFFDLRAIKGARIVLFVAATGGYKPGREEHAPVAQRIERLTTDQKVMGSTPVRCAILYKDIDIKLIRDYFKELIINC